MKVYRFKRIPPEQETQYEEQLSAIIGDKFVNLIILPLTTPFTILRTTEDLTEDEFTAVKDVIEGG